MPEPIHDPVSRTHYTFEHEGENLVVYTRLEPGGGLPPHMHPAQEERWSVVEGRIRFQLGNEKRVIGPEDGEMLVPPNTKHGLQAVEDHDVQLKCVAIPALGLQSFLEESAAAARDGLFMRGGIPRGLRGARWAARFLKKYEDETVMLFPPRPLQRLLVALLARGG
jgi:quercetin dioxygenase-like cupin family protein